LEFANEANRWGLIHAYVAACKRVRSIEKGAADAAGQAVIHAFLPLPDVLAARQYHGSHLSDISNGELMESAKKKNQINGCPDFLMGRILTVLKSSSQVLTEASKALLECADIVPVRITIDTNCSRQKVLH